MINDAVAKMNVQAWPTIEQQFRNGFEKQLLTSITEGKMTRQPFYARDLTMQEMPDIEAFYRTPTGAKMVKLMPQMMGEVTGNLAPRTCRARCSASMRLYRNPAQARL